MKKKNLIEVCVGIAISSAFIGSCCYAWHCGNQNYLESLDVANAINADVTNAVADNIEIIGNENSTVVNAEADAQRAAIAAAQASYSSGGGSGYYSSDPYNFEYLGVLYDNDYRYTYYSSNVRRHYRTDEWTLGDDGIYRDSSGRVIVASDDYAEGTVVQSDIFGECIVSDCGVGSSGTLDVYVGY